MRGVVFSSVVLLFLASAVSAETYLVLPDGTGDFLTIQEAINASVNGDVVELGDGTFRGPGNRDLDYHGKTITVRSQSGDPTSCVIDCEGVPGETRRGFRFHSSEGPLSVLEGVTVANGYADAAAQSYGGALLLSESSPSVVNCIFLGNRARHGGAVYAYHGTPRFVECLFEQNDALDGGALALMYADAQIDACVLSMNTGGTGGAIICRGGMLRLTSCTSHLNDGGLGAVLLCEYSCTAWVTGSTLCRDHANASAVVFVDSGSHVQLENTIIAFSTGGSRGLVCAGGDTSAFMICCNLYGNEGGDWDWWCIEDQLGLRGNIREDPMFCDIEGGDLTLDCLSPCAPDNSTYCGQIGAWPVGCGASPAMCTTWGHLKSLFRP